MNELILNPILLLVICVLAVFILVAWVTFRNVKDEEEFEQNMDAPQQITKTKHNH